MNIKQINDNIKDLETELKTIGYTYKQVLKLDDDESTQASFCAGRLSLLYELKEGYR